MIIALARYEPVPLDVKTDRREWTLLRGYLSSIPFWSTASDVPCRSHVLRSMTAWALQGCSSGGSSLSTATPRRTRFGSHAGHKGVSGADHPGRSQFAAGRPVSADTHPILRFPEQACGASLLQHQHARLVNAGDFAHSQSAALHDALDALTSNQFAMGEHHLSLQVLSDPVPAARRWPTLSSVIDTLGERLGVARALLADTGMTVAREDLALEAGFWASVARQFRDARTARSDHEPELRRAQPLAQLSKGRSKGNHWGEALTLLKTSAGSPFYFSLHASDPVQRGGTARISGTPSYAVRPARARPS